MFAVLSKSKRFRFDEFVGSHLRSIIDPFNPLYEVLNVPINGMQESLLE